MKNKGQNPFWLYAAALIIAPLFPPISPIVSLILFVIAINKKLD
jgi:hypothetical protein